MQKERKRTLDQNAKLWSMLGEVSDQLEHCGNKYSKEEWASIFLHACGHQMKFLPSLDGKTFVPHRASTRALTVDEMSEMLECIAAEGTMRGVKFADDQGVTWNKPPEAA